MQQVKSSCNKFNESYSRINNGDKVFKFNFVIIYLYFISYSIKKEARKREFKDHEYFMINYHYGYMTRLVPYCFTVIDVRRNPVKFHRIMNFFYTISRQIFLTSQYNGFFWSGEGSKPAPHNPK